MHAPLALHLSLNVTHLERSVEFYARLFDMPPTKQRSDYAKFEVEQPPLVLSLEPAATSGGGTLNHVGLRLDSAVNLVDLQRRLELAGLASQREEGVECCYARQTKFWLHDPDNTLWEFYVLEGNLEHRGAGSSEEVVRGGAVLAPNAAEPTTLSEEAASSREWEHRLGEPWPESLPFEEGTLTEVRLRGSLNAREAEGRTIEWLHEARQFLAPGGRLVLHQLTAERAFENGPPKLPGPAAVVEHVPVDIALFHAIEDAGFTGLHLLKFGESPCFTVEGIAMRETLLEATTPNGDASSTGTATVLYKGPFPELVDDAGHVFPRGRRTNVPIDVRDALRRGPLAESFTFFPPVDVHELV